MFASHLNLLSVKQPFIRDEKGDTYQQRSDEKLLLDSIQSSVTKMLENFKEWGIL